MTGPAHSARSSSLRVAGTGCPLLHNRVTDNYQRIRLWTGARCPHTTTVPAAPTPAGCAATPPTQQHVASFSRPPLACKACVDTCLLGVTLGRHTGERLSECLCWHILWTASLHENQGWSLVGGGGGNVSRRLDRSRLCFFRMADCFFRMTDSSGDCTNSVSATGVVVVFQGRQGGCAGREGYDSVRTHSRSDNGDRNTTQPTVPKDGDSPRWLGRLLSMVEARRTLRPGSSRQRQSRKARGTNLGSWMMTDASTLESSSAAISCTSWCSPAPRPGRRAFRSAIPF